MLISVLSLSGSLGPKDRTGVGNGLSLSDGPKGPAVGGVVWPLARGRGWDVPSGAGSASLDPPWSSGLLGGTGGVGLVMELFPWLTQKIHASLVSSGHL